MESFRELVPRFCTNSIRFHNYKNLVTHNATVQNHPTRIQSKNEFHVALDSSRIKESKKTKQPQVKIYEVIDPSFLTSESLFDFQKKKTFPPQSNDFPHTFKLTIITSRQLLTKLQNTFPLFFLFVFLFIDSINCVFVISAAFFFRFSLEKIFLHYNFLRQPLFICLPSSGVPFRISLKKHKK